MIIEEDILVGRMKTDVSYWYVSNGLPIFVSVQCSENSPGTSDRRAYVNLNFRRLNMRLTSAPCPNEVLTRPINWDVQVKVVSQLAKHVPDIVRVDLYAGERKLSFQSLPIPQVFVEGGFISIRVWPMAFCMPSSTASLILQP